MTRYNLDGLGADTFEDMVVSLSLGVIGPGVTAFGAGPDGGREATYRGPINWSKTGSSGMNVGHRTGLSWGFSF
jgi:hypothetical protein